MAKNRLGKFGRVAPLVIFPVAFFAAQSWLGQQNDVIKTGILAAFGIFVMGYSTYLAARFNRRLDEVEIAGQRFAHSTGMGIGTFVAMLVVIVSMGALVDLANSIGSESPDEAVKVGIVLGITLVCIMQLLALVAVSIWWHLRMVGSQS